MVTENLRMLRVLSQELRKEEGVDTDRSNMLRGKMEEIIGNIRNKKNRGRGEAVSQEPPPTVVPESRFVTDAITGGHGFRLVTENGPHRSRFEQQD